MITLVNPTLPYGFAKRHGVILLEAGDAVPADARHRMVSVFDYDTTVDNWALGFRFDIVLRGREATHFEDEEADDDE